MTKKITDEQLNQYLEIRTELGEENFKFINCCYDEVLRLKKEEATKNIKFEITDFSKFRDFAKK